MKTLNLVYPEKSDIKYRIDRFPDGQQQLSILPYKNQPWSILGDEVIIKSRLNNFFDLELIICAKKSIDKMFSNPRYIHLYTPYFLGSRSDRQFEEGSNNYLKDIICPIINSLNFDSVTVLDPHSDVLEACLNNFKKESNAGFVDDSISKIYGDENVEWNNFILVSPDAGASKKIHKLAEQIGYKEEIITCSKERDTEGKLTITIVPNLSFKFDKDIIIIDDICDGGATFINIAKEIKNQLEFHKASGYKNNSKIYLIVTHGVFSKGFEELSKYFDEIYCTNSYQDLSGKLSGEQWNKDFVKQLNVF